MEEDPFEKNEIWEQFYEKCIEERILEEYGVNVELYKNYDFNYGECGK